MQPPPIFLSRASGSFPCDLMALGMSLCHSLDLGASQHPFHLHSPPLHAGSVCTGTWPRVGQPALRSKVGWLNRESTNDQTNKQRGNSQRRPNRSKCMNLAALLRPHSWGEALRGAGITPKPCSVRSWLNCIGNRDCESGDVLFPWKRFILSRVVWGVNTRAHHHLPKLRPQAVR